MRRKTPTIWMWKATAMSDGQDLKEAFARAGMLEAVELLVELLDEMGKDDPRRWKQHTTETLILKTVAHATAAEHCDHETQFLEAVHAFGRAGMLVQRLLDVGYPGRTRLEFYNESLGEPYAAD